MNDFQKSPLKISLFFSGAYYTVMWKVIFSATPNFWTFLLLPKSIEGYKFVLKVVVTLALTYDLVKTVLYLAISNMRTIYDHSA